MADTNAVASLDTAIEQITARIKDVTANAHPDYSLDGQSVSPAAYLASLTAQLLPLLQARQLLAGPVEYQTIGVT